MRVDDSVEKAIIEVRKVGLSDEQIKMLFDGDKSISTREALLISNVQHLEGKLIALTDMLEEMATVNNMNASTIAKITLDKIAPVRKIKESNDS